jgi:hypothetical protein
MQRSSPSIGTLAAALAKAQGELVSPRSRSSPPSAGWTEGAELTFRYAPLSSGLDGCARFGADEIATVHTTSIDHDVGGLINLTTVLAHASAEWIASDWPVCAISETATSYRARNISFLPP